MFDRISLQKYISDNGLKQKTIADKAELPESTLSMILTGKRKCEVNEFFAICKAIKVSPMKFVVKNQDTA